MAAAIPASMLNTPSGQAAAAPDARARLAENFETFLTLLTTQLKNQDPLAPMDGNQFTQQLVQMTGVEQQLQANDLLRKLVAQGADAPAASLPGGVELIGKTVVAQQPTAVLRDGAAGWTYELPARAKTATLEILNAKGEVVFTAPPPSLEAGEHAFTWNGVDADGEPLPRGVYTLRVTGQTTGGAMMEAAYPLTGVVASSELIDGQTWLSLGARKVKLETVTAVRQSS